MRGIASIGLISAVIVLHLHSPTRAAITGLQRVASGLSAPIFATHAPGDRNRLFIAERGGAVRILNLNTGGLEPTPFLTMTGIDTGGSEGGFLGLAFHPDYFDEDADGYGKFYVKITTSGSALTARIREYTVSDTNPNLANPSSLRDVLTYTNPQANHVGGWIGFSPNNNYLYIANGDGGGGNDNGTGHTNEPTVKGNAQDITNNFLGKMLRIDPVDPDGMGPANYSIPPTNPMVADVGVPSDDLGDDEIWAYGLRNPFRSSFDRITGDLWIGDVGQGAREEVDFQPASSPGGENYGWRLREGSIQTPTAGIGGPCPGCTEPAYDYARPISDPPPLDPVITAMNQYRGTTVIGGYVYRGPDPSLQGQYLFLDRDGGTAGINYWRFDPDDPYASVQNIDSMMAPNVGSAGGPVSMGEDAVGNLYITYFTGEVYRIATNQLLPGDYNADGEVDDLDYGRWRATFGTNTGPRPADGNGNGVVDAADYVLWRKNFGASVHDDPGAGGSSVPELASAWYVAPSLGLLLLSRLRRGQSRRRYVRCI
jgi:glucose/arabinose dehydrogenase